MIIHCDNEVLDNPVVMDFLQKDDMCSIPENISKQLAPYSKDWTGPDAMNVAREQDPAELTRQDQIYLQTAFELHYYWKSRMRALALTRSFEVDYDEITDKMRQVVDVSESLRDSVSLMNVLGLILDIGNYMNDANKQARGFKLSSLARLGMVKDDKNQSTLADLVERIVRQQYPEWDVFADDIQGVMVAQKINIEALQSDAKKYIDNVRNVQMSLDSGNLSDPKKFHPQDRVSQIVQRTMKEARRKADQMELYLEEMSRTYNEIMAFYGEDATDENARRDFFAKLALFISEWKKSREKNITFEKQRRINEESMRRKNANLQVALGRADGGPVSPSSAGAMDSLLEKLRAAAPQGRDKREQRRRARLKDRHQNRIASGQKIPDINEIPEIENGLQSAKSVDSHGTDDTAATGSAAGGLLSPTSMPSPREEEDDVADRAAMLLQGMRDGADEGDEEKRRETRLEARRRTAQDERNRRRGRRERATSAQPPPRENGTQANGDEEEEGSVAVNEADQEVDHDAEGDDVPTPRAEEEAPAPEV